MDIFSGLSLGRVVGGRFVEATRFVNIKLYLNSESHKARYHVLDIADIMSNIDDACCSSASLMKLNIYLF